MELLPLYGLNQQQIFFTENYKDAIFVITSSGVQKVHPRVATYEIKNLEVLRNQLKNE